MRLVHFVIGASPGFSGGTNRFLLLLILALVSVSGNAQIDPEQRRLIQLGYNQPLEGKAPIAAYGFYYYNRPGFFQTNLTLRLALAPIYVDAELGISQLIGPHTDVAIGISGGGFADSYSEIRGGGFRQEESFTGHGGDLSASVYHRFNPNYMIPLWAIFRVSGDVAFYERDRKTDPAFEVPEDIQALNFRTGLRLGGREPSLTAPLAMEVSAWYEGVFRTEGNRYGFGEDREVEAQTHRFWTRALLKYTFDPSEQYVDFSITAGTSLEADRFSAYRLGGFLPFSSEFPLSIPGYYFQELSAKRFFLVNGQYAFPLEPEKNWSVSIFGATGMVDYTDGLEQPGDWHSGVGGGITYASPSRSWFVSVVYGYGIDAIRHEKRGANQVGLLFQYDFDAKKRDPLRPFRPEVNPYRSRGGERIFR
ncbi:MAG: hypothetical protein SFY81_11890 [Verrucomicrobiota bacterium]|nr:hypothetical protein [Verrucomicrobiota bacterium]